MEIFRFFIAISPNLLILRVLTGNVFASASRTSGRTVKRSPPCDPASRNGLFTCSREVLTVDEGVSGWGLQMAESGTFLLPLREPVAVRPNGHHHSIQRVE